MLLEAVGFRDRNGRLASMMSLKLQFPTFLASWQVGRREGVNKEG